MAKGPLEMQVSLKMEILMDQGPLETQDSTRGKESMARGPLEVQAKSRSEKMTLGKSVRKSRTKHRRGLEDITGHTAEKGEVERKAGKKKG